MRVYVEVPEGLSRAMGRVAKAFKIHAPANVRFTKDIDSADLIILHVIGFPETEQLVQSIRAQRKKYAIMQYCFRSTQAPRADRWLPLWQGAEAVWSYLDLAKHCEEDGVEPNFKFYHAPLGVDPTSFRQWPTPKRFDILTSGYVMETEGVLEAMAAVEQIEGKQFHLGPPDERFKSFVTQKLGINDDDLAQTYSRCRFVAGLRRVEGFEMPAAEGLLCGARPLMFNRPHYRQWFGELAEYVPEDDFHGTAAAIADKLAAPYRAVTAEEIAEAKERFDWGKLLEGFWSVATSKPVSIQVGTTKRTLLWVGDACVPTGFALATHKILDVVREHWNVHVLGLNYYGDKHEYPYDVYPCRSFTSNDPLGVPRIPELVSKLRPDLIVVQNDPWHVKRYVKAAGNVPVTAIVAVDGKNCRGTELNGLRSAIFWTQFGMHEARAGGYTGPAAVIPLGVDLTSYYPMDKRECRRSLPFNEADLNRLENAFIVGNVNRNQPRKRMDLTMLYFAEWIRSKSIDDAYLYLHVGPTGDVGYDIYQLARYLGISNRLVHIEPVAGEGETIDGMRKTYNCMDVVASTSQGEGWGLPALEAMACGVPVMAGDWSAMGEWAKPAALLVPCTTVACTTNNINSIGGIPDRDHYIQALDRLYNDHAMRENYANAGLQLAADPVFNWRHIGEQYVRVLDQSMSIQVLDKSA